MNIAQLYVRNNIKLTDQYEMSLLWLRQDSAKFQFLP